MRVSSGLPETGLCGKMRMNTRPSRRRKCDARHAAGFDLPGGDPAASSRLQAVFAERDGIAAGGVAFHLAALAFAELHPLGHHWHKTPISVLDFKSRQI